MSKIARLFLLPRLLRLPVPPFLSLLAVSCVCIAGISPLPYSLVPHEMGGLHFLLCSALGEW
jgi:hypothetical protein